MHASASPVPQLWLEGCCAAHRRLEAVIAPLTDAMARRPSLLPAWTVGHLLTHLARNADSQTGMVQAAQRGAMSAQYPGGPAQRASDIAAGAGRPAAALVADVQTAQALLEQAWATTSVPVWATGLGLSAAGPRTLAELVLRRWREVEVHLVDLGLRELGSPDWDGLSPAYVEAEWAETITRLGERVPAGVTLLLVPGDRPSRVYGTGADADHVIVQASPGRLLGWLLGRGGEPSWPTLRPWE